MSNTKEDTSNMEHSSKEKLENILEEDSIEVEEQDSPSVLLISLLDILSKKLLENGVSVELNNIPTIMTYSMEIIEKLAKTPGNILNTERKDMAKNMVIYLIKKSPLSDETKLLCNEVLAGTLLDDMIEIIIKASKGKIGLNNETIEDVVEITRKCCIPFFKKKSVKK